MRFLVIALLCTIVSLGAYAQKNSIPAKAKSSFLSTYPSASKVKWEQEDDKYEVSFLDKGHKMSILYGSTGNALETEVQINQAELPKAALQYASAKGKIKEAARITKANGEVVYEAEVNGNDLLFTTQGGYISEKQDKD